MDRLVSVVPLQASWSSSGFSPKIIPAKIIHISFKSFAEVLMSPLAPFLKFRAIDFPFL